MKLHEGWASGKFNLHPFGHLVAQYLLLQVLCLNLSDLLL